MSIIVLQISTEFSRTEQKGKKALKYIYIYIWYHICMKLPLPLGPRRHFGWESKIILGILFLLFYHWKDLYKILHIMTSTLQQ